MAFRLAYALRRRTGGLIRSSPTLDWERVCPTAREALIGRLFAVSPEPSENCIREADSIVGGNCRLFSIHVVAVGIEPDWARNQLTGENVPVDRHWSRLGDFSFGDIKGVWELSRFGWAYALARAYAGKKEERYAERFWFLFESWCRHARPNAGPNWMCGQEAAIRLMAVAFARHVLAGAAATTRERTAAFRRFVLVTGRRIAANLDYALSQSNNHGVSECVGLITVSLLLPEATESSEWRRRGLKMLECQLAELVYVDGAFAQHSAIYHRLLLHALLWCIAVLRAADEVVPDWLLLSGRRALAFIEALMNPRTGLMPMYGANDGADILPLADSAYLDFRPVVQGAYAVLHGRRRLPAGPWDEMADWLNPEPVSQRVRETGVVAVQGDRGYFPAGGCLVWRAGDTRLFFRCPTRFRHRPSQADLLHVDIEWRGLPVARDAGTYSYNTTGPFRGALKEAAVHNTLTFDGREPMQKVGRFLYLPWPKGHVESTLPSGGFRAGHDGWNRQGIVHTREIRPTSDKNFEVRDLMTVHARRRARLHWLLEDHPYDFEPANQRLILHTPAGDYVLAWQAPAAKATLVRAGLDVPRGWWSPHYAQAVPALSLAIEFDVATSCEAVTKFAPAASWQSAVA